ncbi:MAG: hypothetical protein EB072_07335 [Betaproteobacteria bacterium]|nr:hypothetical protein [Betaproteobacteria bacterium]
MSRPLSQMPIMLRTAHRLAALFLAACMLNAKAAEDAANKTVSNSNIDGGLLYQLLLGELNAQQGEPGAAFSLLLDAARKTQDPKLFQRAVEIALQARSGESALQAARAWRQALPSSREANRFVLQILLGLNRTQETADPLKREITLTPEADRAALISVVPRFYARASDRKMAAQIVEQTLSEFANKPETAVASWTSIGRMRLQAENRSGALDAAQRAHSLDAQAVGPILLALALMNQQQTQAETLVRRYLARQPSPEVRMEYARALLNNQRFAESLEQIQMVTRSQAGFADAWLFQGSLELQNNQFKEAETSLMRYLQLSGSAPEAQQNAFGDTDERTRGLVSAYLALAQIAEQRKDFAGSEAWLAKIGSPEDVVRVQSRRASLLAKQGKLDEARQLLQQLPARSEADARFKLAAELQLLRDYRKYAQAYELLNQALKKSPNDVEWLYEQAMLAEKMGNIGVMERLLRQVIAIKPDYHHAYNALGYSFADRNVRLAEAKQLITKALEFAPADPFITDSLAWVEFRLGNKEEALRLLQWAFKNRPDAEIAAHLGEVLWSLNRKDEALSIWREGKGLNADNDTLLDTLKRLGVNP